jgi:hypothetical protein
VLRELYPLDAAEDSPPAHACECGEEEWWSRFERELGRDLAQPPTLTGEDAARQLVPGATSATVAIAELVSSGAGVLAVCADASRRAELAGGATGLARFNGGAALLACHRCAAESVAGLAARGAGGLALTDYRALGLAPELAAAFEHVVLVDPPPGAAEAARASLAPSNGAAGFLHPLWTEAEKPFALDVLAEQTASRDTVARLFRTLRAREDAGGETLRAALGGGGAHPLAAEGAARAFRVLRELNLVAGEPNAGGGGVGAVSSEKTDLERSAAFRAYRDRFSEAQRFLERPK